MTSLTRPARIATAVALIAGGVFATTAATSTAADAAAAPSCPTTVSGFQSDGRLVQRAVRGTQVVGEKKSATALSYPVEDAVVMGVADVKDGWVAYVDTFTAGKMPHAIDVTNVSTSASLSVKPDADFRYVGRPNGHLIAGSGRYYIYGLDANGALKRWTRVGDGGDLAFDNRGAKVVKKGMSGLRTLSYSSTFKIGGALTDVLYGTTTSGALLQFQIPWGHPERVKTTTLRKTGFSAYRGLSLSYCGSNPTYLSFVAIDRVHNQARWFTLRNQTTPVSANLVQRGLVGKGLNWHLHATS